MIYPTTVMISAMFIVLGLMMFVIPTFTEILADLSDGKYKLPGITLVLMRTSEWLVGRSGLNGLTVIVTPFLIIAGLKLIRRFQAGRYVFDTIKLKLPILRKIVYKTSVARWTRTLATLINAGVPLLEALSITRETASNEVHSRMLGKVQHAIRQGDTFANPLRQSNTVDWVVVNMLEVGEEAGDMDKMLVKVANNFDEEADLMISGMMSLLEPIMILFLGAIVGTIVLAIFLPIIEILPGMLGR
jgi:type IV pilus assembly protein PilC